MRWSKEEELLLSINYPIYGGVYCATILPNRDQYSIKRKATRMGLKSPNNKKKTTDQYVDDLILQEIDIYPIEEYAGNSTPIYHKSLDCPHTWKAAPNNILSKRSKCPCCKYNFTEGSNVVYFISFIYEDIKYYKIGVTNQPLSKRFAGDWHRLNMCLEWYIELPTRKEALDMEKLLLNRNSDFKINTGALLRGGNTETLTVYVNKPNEYI